ncbi:MAG: hypothetical protein OHK0013_13330 [Sandaracinaceae bacterium]
MEPAFPPLGPATRNLLIAVVVAFVAQTLVQGGGGLPLYDWLAISPTPTPGWAWQWATHWIVSAQGQGAAFRRLVELLFVYFMGAQYEVLAGARRTYALAAAGVVGAALGTFATAWITPLASWADLGLTTALMTGLATRLHGVPMRFFLLPPMSGWVFVAVFGVVALLDAVWSQFAPIFGSYAGAVGAAYAIERVARMRPKKPAESARGPARRKAPHPFKVIEGGARGDDDRPKYLN